MAASILAGLLITCGSAAGQEASKGDRTLSFVRDAVPGQTLPPAAFVVPAPSLTETPAGMPGAESTPPQLPADAHIRTVAAQGVYPEGHEAGVLPGPSRLFKRVSENDVFDEIRVQARRKPGAARALFPEDIVLSKDVYMGRSWSPMVQTVEPNYVGHGRLYFEQPNFERGGWDFGIFQPMISLGVFYADVAMLPYQFCTRPLQRYDASAGKCLPGDPSPLFLYPPELSLSGAGAEAATVAGLLLLFPR